MSDRKQSAGRVVIGEGESVSRFRLHPKTMKIVLLALAVLGLLLAGLVLNHYVLNPPLSDAEQGALSKATTSAKGFDAKDKGYTLTELNTAVKFAIDKKCVESRAVYDKVAGNPNGVSTLDLKTYKAKIDSLCSAK